MGIIQMNPDDIQDPFAVAPEGRYTVECISAEDTTSQTGNRMIKMKLQVVDGEVDDIEEHIGKTIFENVVLEGDGARFGLFRLKQYCEAAGLDLAEGVNESDFINMPFTVDISISPPDPEKGYDEGNNIKRVYVE